MNYYTVKQSASILNLSCDRIRKKILQKQRVCFPGAVKPGDEWLIPIEEVLKEKNNREEK